MGNAKLNRGPAGGAGRDREAVRPRPGVGARAGRHRAPLVPGVAGLPDRPLPGQGDRPEHLRAAVREHDLRADLEQRLRRPRAADGRRVARASSTAPRFYEETGVVRDIVQNHLLQVLSLVAMEPPAAFEAEAVRDEKAKLLRAVRPMSVRGLGARPVRRRVRGRRARCTATARSRTCPPTASTPTYIAAKLEIDNWRWAGTPFYIRTGKRLAKRVTEVAVQFKRPAAPAVLPRGIGAPGGELAGAADPAGRGHLAALRRQGARRRRSRSAASTWTSCTARRS